MKLVRLVIRGISYSQTQKGAYALILNDVATDRKLPIVIGTFEAQSIAIALENRSKNKANRPLTHDLFKNFAEIFSICIREVVIEKLENGIFYSYIVCERKQGEIVKIDSRTSDAIALAVRFDSPIYTSDKVMQQGSIYMQLNDVEGRESHSKDDSNLEQEKSEEGGLKDLTLEELYEYLGLSVEEEDYEQAACIRDEIEKRKKNS